MPSHPDPSAPESERISVDFLREYCSLLLPDMACGPRIYAYEHRYNYQVALPVAGSPSISRPGSTGLGWFDEWPMELLTGILENMVDIKSLLAFSQVSVQAYNIVHALSAFQDVKGHAGRALSILGATGLLARHSVTPLDARRVGPRTRLSRPGGR